MKPSRPFPNQAGLDRRQFLIGSSALPVGAAVSAGWLWSCHAPQPLSAKEVRANKNRSKEKSPAELITAPAQAAIDRGLAFLSRRQIKSGPNRGGFGNSGPQSGVAVGSLGGLAMMCGGSAPAEGKYGMHVERCVEFVLKHVRRSGYIARTDNAVNENMYGHGFAMLFLAESYGMTQKTEIGEKLRRAVQLTVRCQNNDGGWRYQPVKQDADLSVTVCQIMGLRAARDAGIHVPDETRSKCIEYVKNSQNANGSFRYTLRGGHATFAMTAAGVTSLYSAGIYEGDQVTKALNFLMGQKPSGAGSSGHYFYGQYYAVQAMWHAGGEYWNQWYPAIRDELLQRQQADGSWTSSHSGEYGTAMACIILQMPLNFLPVFAP